MGETCNIHSGLVQDISSLKISDERQWEIINKLQNRLPAWATLIISLLTFFLGLSIGFIGMK